MSFQNDEVMRQLREKDLIISQLHSQFEEIEARYNAKEEVFRQNKTYLEEVLKELKVKKNEIQNLQKEKQILMVTEGSTKEITEQLKEVQKERDSLEERLRELTTAPFFKREAGESAFKRVNELEKQVYDKDRIIRNLKEKTLKMDDE
jgi:iron-sulfur cluster repair protein YtfE (RIC family)